MPKDTIMYRKPALLACFLATVALRSIAAQTATDPVWQEVGKAFSGTPTDGGGYVRYNFPRSDLKVMLGDVSLASAFAVTSWAGFSGTAAMSHVMGDIVSTETELPKVLKALADGGFDVTAIHDHLNGEVPRLAYVHYHAMGAAVAIGRKLDGVFKMTGAPRPVVAPAAPAPLTVDTAKIWAALGKRGKASGAVASLSYQLVSEPVIVDGAPVFPALGFGTPIVIQQVSATRAVTTGDFAVLARQLQPVLRALAANGITATAVHNHLVGATPNVYYAHFWGDGSLDKLLVGLKAALDAAK